MYLIGLFSVDNGLVHRLISINDYNSAVPRLNRLLREKMLVDYFLPGEKPVIARRHGLLKNLWGGKNL